MVFIPLRSVLFISITFLGGPHAERLPVWANLALLTSMMCRSCRHTTGHVEARLNCKLTYMPRYHPVVRAQEEGRGGEEMPRDRQEGHEA
jgi:hypothetical protein